MNSKPIRGALFSGCGRYRYRLIRDWQPQLPAPRSCLFVLNNPSVASAEVDDATCRRGQDYAHAWGFDRMFFGNTNPHCSTDPRGAIIPPEDILAENDKHLLDMAQKSELVVAAWGNAAVPRLALRAFVTLRVAGFVHALAFTKRGEPGHILYLKKDLKPIIWNGIDFSNNRG